MWFGKMFRRRELEIMLVQVIVYFGQPNIGVFPKWSRAFAGFSEFRETDKSLKHELGSI